MGFGKQGEKECLGKYLSQLAVGRTGKGEELERWKVMYGFVPDDLKRFISSTRKDAVESYKKEVREMVNSKYHYHVSYGVSESDIRINNQVVDDIINSPLLASEEK